MLQKWLKISTSKFINFWHEKTNRTTVQTIVLTAGESTEEMRVPDGTYAFNVRSQGTTIGNVEMNFALGQILIRSLVVPGSANIEYFEGQPYIERSDKFSFKNLGVGANIATIRIVYHRVMKMNT